MTDRPPLDDLDAEPEPERWCCSGNAEDCPLCDTRTLPYPWICPGHPDTEANRQRVQAAHEAPTPAPWPQLEAHAFNAVQPALREAGEWLRLSSRRAVARAVLAAVQPHLAVHYQNAVDAAVAAEARAEQAENRLRLAHQARRGKEQQLDDVRRALCDIGFMGDDDPYSHADLADVIRQNGQAPLGPSTHNAGPSVREAAEADRRWWNGEKAGEQL
jgi:hypothetical protein